MYKCFDLGSYKLHCIKNNRFKETKLIINFKRKVKKEEITLRSLLSKVMLESTKNYPTSRLMAIKTEDLYNSMLGSSSYLSGNYSVISFETMFLNDVYVGDDLFNKAVDFILEIINNPNVSDNKFDSKTFELAKKSLKEEIESLKDNPRRYGMLKLYQEIDSKAVSSYNAVGYLSDLEKITEESLYEYYKSIFKKDIMDIFIISPNEFDEVKEMFRKKLDYKVLRKKSESHFVDYNKYRSKNKIVHEKSDFEQSNLYVACKFDKLTDFERKYVSVVYSYILGGGPSSKLFTTVREENSLCYSISSSFKGIYKFLVISAGINAKDFKKCLSLTKKQIKDMALGKFEEEKIDEAIITYLNSFKELKDSPSSILNTYISHEYFDADLIEEREKNIKKVTKDMVINFAKKVHIDTVYVLEGKKKDE